MPLSCRREGRAIPGHLLRNCLCLAAVAASLILAGCASLERAPSHETARPQGGGVRDVRQALYGELDRWRGTRYRLGGTGKKGFDCSGFTYVVYRDVFGQRLPRTTERQATVGRPVSRDALAPGDLVFFKTGRHKKHVGIYVEDGLFLHASTSDGVRMSSLSNDYWRGHYWKARRVGPI